MSGIPAPDAIFARAAPLIREAEGFSAKPYRDAGGVPTIGFGSTHYSDGRAVSLTDLPISRADAGALLQGAMAAAWKALVPHLARAPSLNQAAALLSLVFNVGAGPVATSLLLAKFNAGDIAGAALRFTDFDKARIGGVLKSLPGLGARRRREAALFLTPDSNSPGKEMT
jgi:lysozyme